MVTSIAETGPTSVEPWGARRAASISAEAAVGQVSRMCYHAVMNKPMEREHLALADRHIAVGERLISEQEARIEKLAAAGHDTTDSAELLALLHTTLGHFLEHRELILDALRRP